MSFNTQVARLLDDEHREQLALADELERALRKRDDAALQSLAAPLLTQIEAEVARHFDFEEQRLFPRMADADDSAVAEMLTEEHETLRHVAADLAPMARTLAAGTLGRDEWAAFQPLAFEWIERMVAHIQKETMLLLPLLDDLLDEASDRELSLAHAAG